MGGRRAIRWAPWVPAALLLALALSPATASGTEPEAAGDGEFGYRLLVGFRGIPEPRPGDVVLGTSGTAVLLGFDSPAALEEARAHYGKQARFAAVDGRVDAAGGRSAETDVDSAAASAEAGTEAAGSDPISIAAAARPAGGPRPGRLVALIDTGAPDAPGVAARLSVLGDDGGDANGHGTAMLETVLSGDPDACVLSIRALDGQGHGTVASVYAAIGLAVESGADIINLSFGAWGSSPAIEAAVEDAAAAGCAVVAAAGNDGAMASAYCPANAEDAIAVGALHGDGRMLEDSNRGPAVDAWVVANSTSYAAARASGWLSAHGDAGDWAGSLLSEGSIARAGADVATAAAQPEPDAPDGPLFGIYAGGVAGTCPYANLADGTYLFRSAGGSGLVLTRASDSASAGMSVTALSAGAANRARQQFAIAQCVSAKARLGPDTYLWPGEDYYVKSATAPSMAVALDGGGTAAEKSWQKAIMWPWAAADYGTHLSLYKVPGGTRVCIHHKNFVSDGSNGHFPSMLNVKSASYANGQEVGFWYERSHAYKTRTHPDGTSDSPYNGVGSDQANAQWIAERCRYTVTFDGNGATGGATARQTVNIDAATALAANGFIRTGYAFAGWAASAAGPSAYADGESVMNLATVHGANVDLYATWSPLAYRQEVQVRYENADGSWGAWTTVVDEDRDYGSTVSWSREADAVYQAASVSYTVDGAATRQVSVARRTAANTIRARYENADGSWGAWEEVSGGMDRVGRERSWSREADAVYQAASASIMGTADAQIAEVSIRRRVYPVRIDLEAPGGGEGTGTFSAWYGSGPWMTGQGGGTSAELRYGQEVRVKDIAPAAGTHVSQVDGATGERDGYRYLAVTGAAAMTIRTAYNGYTVEYDGNGADSGGCAAQPMTCGTPAALSDGGGYSRAGHELAGWNTEPDGTGTSYALGEEASDLADGDGTTVVLYAQWDPFIGLPMTGMGGDGILRLAAIAAAVASALLALPFRREEGGP